MGYAAGLEIALKERDAEIARLRAWGERFEQSFYDTSSKAAEYREESARLRAALRLACQDLRGPGVPIDDLVADYLRAADHGTERAPPGATG